MTWNTGYAISTFQFLKHALRSNFDPPWSLHPQFRIQEKKRLAKERGRLAPTILGRHTQLDGDDPGTTKSLAGFRQVKGVDADHIPIARIGF